MSDRPLAQGWSGPEATIVALQATVASLLETLRTIQTTAKQYPSERAQHVLDAIVNKARDAIDGAREG